MSHAIIHFLCPVTQQSVNILQDRCLNALAGGADSIELHISSLGGDLYAGFSGYEFLRSLPVPVHTHNVSNVESSATILYLAGAHRTATPTARFLFHPFHWNCPLAPIDHARMAEWTASLDMDIQRYRQIIAEATRANAGMLDRLTGSAHFMSAEDAVAADVTFKIQRREAFAAAPDIVSWVISS